MMSYIYTLVIESQNLSSIPASFLIRNAKKVVWWLIGGAFVAQGARNFCPLAPYLGSIKEINIDKQKS